MFRWINPRGLAVYLPVIISRIALFVFCAFGIFINQFSSSKIEGFLHAIPYRCPLRLITGWKCAFCGMTHSWIALFRGDFSTAFQENLLGPALWLTTLLFLVLLSFNKKIKADLKPSLVVLSILVVYTLVRNLV